MTVETKTKNAIAIVVKDANRFSDKVSSIADACSVSSSIPILTCMKIEVKAGSAVFTGGNGIVTICMGEKDVVASDQDTSIAVPAKLFAEIISRLPSGEIHLTIKGEKLLIEAGKVKFDISILDVSQYPTITVDKNVLSSFRIPASSLVAALKSTMYATSSNQTMPALTGVCFEVTQGETNLKFTATDRNRLACSLVGSVVTAPFREVVSSTTCKEITRIFSDINQEVTLTFTESAISIMGPGIMMISQLLDHKYPETDKLLPTTFEVEVTQERDKLLGALTRAKVFAKDKKMVIFNLKDDELSITSKAENGQVLEVLDCQTHGKELRIGLDVFYLIESLKAIEEMEVRLSFSGPVTPVLIKPENDSIKTLALVIPIRITGE